jgi:hypothetical protein
MAAEQRKAVPLKQPRLRPGHRHAQLPKYLLSSEWNAGKSLTLRAGDINRDGTADL